MTLLWTVTLAMCAGAVVASSLPDLAAAPETLDLAEPLAEVETPQSDAVSSLVKHLELSETKSSYSKAKTPTAAATKMSAAGNDDEYKSEPAYKQETEYKQEYTTTTPYTTTTTTTRCYPYYVPYQVDKCIPWTELVCHTTQKETCSDVPDKNCRPLVTSKQTRKCFPVTEEVCRLHEEVKYETVKEPYTIQKCHKVPEKVCDVVYEPSTTTRDKQLCENIQKPYCKESYYSLYDKVCRSYTDFDCDYEYGAGGANSNSNSGNKGSGYDYEPYCKKREYNKCYQTPRRAADQKCYNKYEKSCQKYQETVPVPKQKLNCHVEEKSVCNMEQHYQPKQIVKYVYTKKCKPVKKQVCANAETKQLVPKCVPTARKQCKYTPVKKCQKNAKKYCYKITKRQRKEKCDRGYEGSGSAAERAPAAPEEQDTPVAAPEAPAEAPAEAAPAEAPAEAQAY